jgi:hypothetical protein
MTDLAPVIGTGAWLLLAVLSIAMVWWRLSRLELDFDRIPPPPQDWVQAEIRAESLLRDLLSEEDYHRLTREGILEIRSPNMPDRVYRIPRHQGRVQVYERGKPVMKLCVQPTRPVPDADIVVMHKLMIEGNEREYLRVANRFGYNTVRVLQ